MDDEKIQRFADLINSSDKTVFFGGAGVSTESGVKDYRSEDGLYNTVKEYGVSPETILSHSFLFQNQIFFTIFITSIFSKKMLSLIQLTMLLQKWRAKANYHL